MSSKTFISQLSQAENIYFYCVKHPTQIKNPCHYRPHEKNTFQPFNKKNCFRHLRMHLNSTAQEKREGVDTNSMPPRAHEKKNSAWQSLHHADVPTQKKNQITRILNRSRIRFIKAGRFYPRRGQDKNTLRKRFWKGNLR